LAVTLAVTLAVEIEMASVGSQYAADDVVGGELLEPLALIAQIFVEAVA
jgi:hypothetical protein